MRWTGHKIDWTELPNCLPTEKKLLSRKERWNWLLHHFYKEVSVNWSFLLGCKTQTIMNFKPVFFRTWKWKKGFTDSSFWKNENNLPQFQHRKVVSHFLKSWFVAGRFPHCWLFWFSFRFFRVLVDFVDLPTYLIKDYLLKILAQTRLCDYKVFFH